MRAAAFFLAFALFLGACDSAPAEAPAQQRVPALTGRVVDNADLLTAEEEQRLSRLSEALERRTTDQLVIVTIASLNGRPIEEVGLELGNTWGIGQRERDNGVLIIVAPNDRKVRVEVGLGLEPILSNPRAQEIVDQAMLPRLRENRWYDAINAGARAISTTLISLADRPRQGR